MKSYQILLFLIIPIFLNAQYKHPIIYQPANYVCYKTDKAPIIDGKLDETIWQKTSPTNDFVDIQGNLKPAPPYQTNVKMLWDETYFYFGAYLEEPHIWGNLTEHDAIIFHENDFEIFLDPDGDSHHYFEFEINALNTVWDLLLLRPYREDRLPKAINGWNIKGLQSAVHINGILNNPSDLDSFWTVEIAIPWKSLKEICPRDHLPKEGVQWRVNFSRVNWDMDVSNGNYVKQKDKKGKNLHEKNWVWSPQGYINMHAPETWGFVQFSEIIAGQEVTYFIDSEEEEIKWALRQLYHQQRRYRHQHKQYTESINALILPKVTIENYTFEPHLLKTFSGYEISAKSAENNDVWIIREDGRVFRKTKE